MSITHRNFIVFVFFAYILILFAGLKPIGFDFDSRSYSNLVYYDTQMIEPTFLLIKYIARIFTSDKELMVRIVFLIYAFLNILILSIAINKFVKFNIVSLVIYTFVAYAMITLTQIRFGVAVAFFLWAIYDLSNLNRKGFLLKILIGTSFHYSLALALPLVFLSSSNFNKKFYIFLPLIFFIGMFLSEYMLNLLLNNLSLFSDYLAFKLKIYAKRNHSESMPIINILSLLLIFIYYLALSIVQKINSKNMLIVIKVFGWGLAFYFLFSFIEVFSKRIMFTLGTLMIVLIPFLLDKFKQKRIILFFLIIYVFLYFINSTVNNGLLDYELYISSISL